MKKCQAIILAAGEGTRMRSRLPKVVHEILGKAMINYVIDEARRAGVEDIVVVTGYGREALEKSFGGRPVTVAIQEEQRGTGDAVRAAVGQLRRGTGECLVLCGDAPLVRAETLRKLVARHRREKASVTVLTGILEDPSGYGRIVREPTGKIARIVEEKDAGSEERQINEVNSGGYVFDTPFMTENIEALRPDNIQKEYYLTDLVYRAFFSGHTVSGYLVPDSDEIMGINSREELAVASGVLAMRKAEELMRKGVTIEDPYNTYVGPDVSVGADSVIEPGVIIRGTTKIGRNVRIGAGACIEASEIRRDAVIRPYCVVVQSVVGSGAQVGPFAHLRPASVLMEGARIGNFVEVKNTKVGKGAKANHLTYLGDSVIGTNVNVGAGTITCNYDGISKHVTEIGDGVFVGSNTELVAPLKVGKGAIIGAGTTVTKDVPSFALALSRAAQENIENWVVKKRPELLKKAGVKIPGRRKKK